MFPQVNPTLVAQIEEKGMHFVGRDVEGERMEIMEIEGTCQLGQVQHQTVHVPNSG